jgi:hypothetical protein
MKQFVKVSFLIEFSALSPVIGKRILVEEEILNIIKTIVSAAEAIQGIKCKYKKIKSPKTKH